MRRRSIVATDWGRSALPASEGGLSALSTIDQLPVATSGVTTTEQLRDAVLPAVGYAAWSDELLRLAYRLQSYARVRSTQARSIRHRPSSGLQDTGLTEKQPHKLYRFQVYLPEQPRHASQRKGSKVTTSKGGRGEGVPAASSDRLSDAPAGGQAPPGRSAHV